MGKEKKSKFKMVFSYMLRVVLGILIFTSVFYLGRIAEKKSAPIESVVIMKSFDTEDVTIAVDQSNNLIIIDNATKYYNVYSDSIGYTIFKMYYKNIIDN